MDDRGTHNCWSCRHLFRRRKLSPGRKTALRSFILSPAVRLIGISGSRSGVGKTQLAEHLLPLLKCSIAIKAARGEGPLKVSREGPTSAAEGKDTGRFVAAGARKAFYMKGPLPEMEQEVWRIMHRNPAEKIIVEANSLADNLPIDQGFFVLGAGPAKPGSASRMARCDVVVLSSIFSAADEGPPDGAPRQSNAVRNREETFNEKNPDLFERNAITGEYKTKISRLEASYRQQEGETRPVKTTRKPARMGLREKLQHLKDVRHAACEGS